MRTLTAIIATAFLLTATAWATPDLPADGDSATKRLAESPRHAESVSVDVVDGGPVQAFVVYPERADNAPVVIVIHEIYGMTDWVRGVADQLAAEGFIAVAPDLLSGMGPDGGGTESIDANAVRQAVRDLDPALIEARLDAVREWAVALPSSTDKIGVTGFCWGGSQTFIYAINAGEKIDAAIVYYGTAPDEGFADIAVPVLGLYGGDDARVTSTVEPTAAAMEEANKEYETHIFDGAGHGFLRQQEGRDGANQSAAKQAWERTLAYFRERLES